MFIKFPVEQTFVMLFESAISHVVSSGILRFSSEVNDALE